MRPAEKAIEQTLALVRRIGIDPDHEVVHTRDALVAALGRCEWDLVLYGDGARNDIPIDLVYTHAPAAAVVRFAPVQDMADELARLVATRDGIE